MERCNGRRDESSHKKQHVGEMCLATREENCWVLVGITIKYKHDGTIEWYKARLVAKGYTQTYEIDYSETFSSVENINTIRILYSMAANKEWPLHQFDVKNAFLHRELQDEVYIEPPHGFKDRFREREICLLKPTIPFYHNYMVTFFRLL